MTLRIALGCDHAGFPLKARVRSVIEDEFAAAEQGPEDVLKQLPLFRIALGR